MKHLFLFLIFCVNLNLCAQDYYSVLDTNYVWRMYSATGDGGQTISEWTYEYYVNGDTLINNISYKIQKE